RALEPHELLEALRARPQRRTLDRRPGVLAAHRTTERDGGELARGGGRAVIELDSAILSGAARTHREHGLQRRVALWHHAHDEIARAERRTVLLRRARGRAHDALGLGLAQ